VSLQIENLSVVRGGRTILSGVGFTAPAGAVTGLIGPNGAGKSTLLHALLGLVPATGSFTFETTDLRALHRRDRARLAALVEQSATTEERLSVREVVALGRIPFEPALAPDSASEDGDIVNAALADTSMTSFDHRRFTTLSGGEQQRVHLARALAQQPRLLLLDEPTSHLDIAAQLDLLALLRRKASTGMTIILALHDLNLAARFCDHLVVLAEGTVAAQGVPATTLTPALLQSVYGVRARLLPDPQTGGTHIVLDPTPANPR
jgi:iron complex transport system ATP-binding protein